MKTHSGLDPLLRLWFFLLAAARIVVPALVLDVLPAGQADNGESAVATYAHGTLHVTVPYPGGHAGAGLLAISVLDPEDHVVGHVTRDVMAATKGGSWLADLSLARPLAIDDLVWHRLRYQFTFRGRKDALIDATESISGILSMPVLHIIGQQSYQTRGPAAVRVVATDSQNRSIAGRSTLRIDLLPAEPKPNLLFTGLLDRRGTAEAQFRLPPRPPGRYGLRYTVDTPIGSAEYTQPVRLKDQVSILLTTEKPIYQPGQTIHVRALALEGSEHRAAAGRKLTLEVEDSRGNKVFKKATQTDLFGVASAEFGLADEVNLGTYHLRALLAEADAGTSKNAEIALNVERYVLPKFKVAVDFTNAKAKHGYRPGDHVTGTVLATYFFGKPVDGAVVTVKASTVDVAVNELGAVEGKTDADGVSHFDLRLPDYFAGRPLSQGAARVLVEATVKDSAAHSQTRGELVTVSESPLILTAVPESGQLIPHLENQIFLLASYPDGTPAAAELRVDAAGEATERVTTDEGGVALIRLKVGGASESLHIEASDSRGDRASATVPLESRGGLDQILLRTDHAVYRAGDRIRVHVLSTKPAGSAYVDIVKDGETVATRDMDIVNGQAELAFTATPQLAGTLDINAYVFGRDARPVADHRLVFVEPADELKIQTTSDAPAYKPGDDARIRFRVTNARGEGVSAALGVQVVDEAVFALAEKQPGFAKVFFYLEQEAMKPRYEIHSIGMAEIVEPVATERAAERDRAARALFAATEMVNPNRFETEVGHSVLETRSADYAVRYRARLSDDVREQLKRVYKQGQDLTQAAATRLRDPWATGLRIEHAPWAPQNTYLVRSAGPDKRFDTADDIALVAQIRSNSPTVVIYPQPPSENRFGGNVMFQQGGARPDTGGGLVGVRQRVGAQEIARFANVPSPAPALSSATVAKEVSVAETPRVRSYFPEALYVNPEIITDADGRASVSIPLADSITTWRMALIASTPGGLLGSASSSLKVFQDFFVDLDLPVRLTQGDRVSIPVAVYNYTSVRGSIDLKLQSADWFSLVDDAPEKRLAVDSGRVGGAQFTLEATRIGKFKLTLAARMNGAAQRADIVVREIEVVPNGREENLVFNGRLETSAQHKLNFPAGAIPDASLVFVRLYPGPLSQVIEGMDSLLRMPFGCFEQTSSATYPNVLALGYMKRTNKLTPEVHAKAEGFIATGYQRLLTFEVPGGGFSWFGQAPANKILTSYGLMEFSDMAKVHEVDPRLIERTRSWLTSQQQPDGSWKPDTSFINEGATNRYNSDLVRITAYIGWALENTGFEGPAVEKARNFVAGRMSDPNRKLDPYTLAVVANFAADSGKDREWTDRVMELLLSARTEKDDLAWWSSEETGVFATGTSASVETTGLAVQALLKYGKGAAIAAKALRYIAAKKDAAGTWGTTQATIMALRALLLSTEKGANDVQGTLEITLNGRAVEALNLNPENSDLFHQFVFPQIDPRSANTVALRFTGSGGLAYQVVGRYFVPWGQQPDHEPLSINVAYDRTRLAEDDIATATATIKNNLTKAANMVMVDLGIPPGFDLASEDLERYQEKSASLRSGRLQKFTLTATQAILYFDSFAPGETATVKFRLRAKYPIRARTFQSRVYEYYEPEVQSVAAPVELEVDPH